MNKTTTAMRCSSVTDICVICPYCQHVEYINVDEFMKRTSIEWEELFYPYGMIEIKCDCCDKEIEIKDFEDE